MWLSIHSPQVEQATQLVGPLGDLDLEEALETVDGAHLIRDGADAADARHDVGHLAEVTTAQERLEEPGRLVDLAARVA